MTNVEKYGLLVDESKKYQDLIENLKNQVPQLWSNIGSKPKNRSLKLPKTQCLSGFSR